MKKLLFGSAGIPLSTPKRNTVNGVKHIRKLGLEAMELEFVRSVNISKEKAPEVKRTAYENKVFLTAHAPYYVNLASLEVAKKKASQFRILKSCRIGHACGAWGVVFHAGYYMEQTPKETFQRIKTSIKEISKKLNNEGLKIWLRPEVSGRVRQFGSLEEVIRLSAELEGVLPCIDFAHLHARTGKNKTYNSYEEFGKVFEMIEKGLGKLALKNMHMHVSGIAYGEKGEQHHLTLKESDFKWRQLCKALKDYKIAGVIISESTNIEKDGILMQKTYNKLE